jgi:DNA-binding winged helix-turn-helix (wHTH) protein
VEPSATAPGTYRFGVFEADLDTGELRKRGRRVPLQDQPFQVLALLLRHPGEIVTREELQRALWPADTFVEFEHGVNTAIKKLRQALGDSADNPRFIETLPRKGYRFIAPAENLTTPSVIPVSAAIPGAAPVPAGVVRPRRLWWLLAGTGLVVVAAGCAAWLLNRPGRQSYPSRFPSPPTLESSRRRASLRRETVWHSPGTGSSRTSSTSTSSRSARKSLPVSRRIRPMISLLPGLRTDAGSPSCAGNPAGSAAYS